MLIFYVRHGEPIYQPDSLTEHGKKQASALVQRMIECNPDRIFSSSSNRAISIRVGRVSAEYFLLAGIMKIMISNIFCRKMNVPRKIVLR